MGAGGVGIVGSWALALVYAQAPSSADLLGPGVHLIRPIASIQADRFTLPLTAGDFVRVEVSEGSLDIAATLHDPEGVEIARSDSGNLMGGVEVIVEKAARTGTYRLEVKLTRPGAGSYRLDVRALRPAEPSDATALTADRRFRAGLRLRRDAKTRSAAVVEFAAAAHAFATAGESIRQAAALLMLGFVEQQSGELRASLRHSEEALALYRSAADTPREALIQGNLGVLLELLGEPIRARQSYLRALEIHRARGYRPSEALMLNNLGFLEANLNRPTVAIEHYRSALALAQEVRNADLEALVRRNMGVAYRGLGEFETATTLLQSALALRQSAANKASTLNALGRLFSLTMATERAIDSYRQALTPAQASGDRNVEAEIHGALGLELARAGRQAEASTAFEQALALTANGQDRRRRAAVRAAYGKGLLLAGDAAGAATRAGEAIAEYHALGASAPEAGALDTLARALRAQNQSVAARARIEEALALLETSRAQVSSPETRAAYFATQQESFSFYIDLLMSLREPALALAAVERYRARSLLDLLTESGVGIRRGVDAQLLDEEQALLQRLNAKATVLMARTGAEATRLKEEIRELDEQYREVQAKIRASSPAYAALAQPEPLAFSNIQARLDADTVLLEYSLGAPRSYLWVVGRGSLRYWELPGRDRIEPQVERVYALLTARAATVRGELPAEGAARIAAADRSLEEASRTLSELILPAGAVPSGKRLVIVADGALQKLPFAMLPVAGEPLAVLHELTVLPSVTALALQRRELSGRAAAPKLLAVFADPDFGSGPVSPDATRILDHLAGAGNAEGSVRPRIPPLPFTRTEARHILAVARGSNFSALGREATRERALSPELAAYRYLHFATHGYLDPDRPGLSALVLAGDGFLRVNDIYQMRLPAELVVLSACQTGLGKEVRGEGLMSFTRAFMYAGAPRVVVSLWNVNDRATASLMAAFYRRMLRDGLTPAAALRQAQLEIRKQKQWQSPYFWAAFVHYGEWLNTGEKTL